MKVITNHASLCPHLGYPAYLSVREDLSRHFVSTPRGGLNSHPLIRSTTNHQPTTMAQDLKAKGNALFKEGDYSGAEEYFSQA